MYFKFFIQKNNITFFQGEKSIVFMRFTYLSTHLISLSSIFFFQNTQTFCHFFLILSYAVLTCPRTLHMHHTSYRTEINSSSRANEKFLGQDISAVYQGALRRGMILLYEGLLLIIHPICGRNSQCEYWLWQALLSSVDSDSPESE